MIRLAPLLPLLLAGCATTEAQVGTAECRNDALPGFIGRTATSELGAEMLKASGARTLRWVAPGMAVTMDYRADRLTVSYDVENKVITASCG